MYKHLKLLVTYFRINIHRSDLTPVLADAEVQGTSIFAPLIIAQIGFNSIDTNKHESDARLY